jgi:hypothetical protein
MGDAMKIRIAIKAIKTTPLMSVEEGIAAMKKAAEVGYKPPQ